MKVVIQCGGLGTRLRPYTMVLPKPLMPVKSKPVLELLLQWLRRNDFTDAYITTGYLGHLIRSFCGDGHQWGMNISYTSEKEPLGTIGPLTMLREELDATFLVINGDVLTDLSLGAFTQVHREQGALVTVAASVRKTKLDFGVIEQTNGRIVGFKEKPSLTNMMSMGVYCMEPRVLDYIPAGVPFGFDDLIHTLLARGLPAHTFAHDGLWLDIGRIEDFQIAQELAWDDQLPAFEVVAAA
ncbi:nucleotidyltransferase [Chelatococcus daeguensis]|uniref:Nucleotidyltransferase n=2 Tax=Chelatococcus TaxID=28209 RepID=A0AAC9JV86_9HYPH|nr:MULTISPECIES: sugar phosphate nucleotidyltransferase [Chelatococcus]APF39266.1 nucleotidyltransferase [Chelatococcus daeguensis]KZE28942.1 nucleotidyltransferase [Chelatococcus daeguensis]MBM3083630.1 nucleotidyltransferase [Chelatococcus daeguensis]CUA87461.1 Nucleotidyl transferase [Chelatococcus sambhunathii]